MGKMKHAIVELWNNPNIIAQLEWLLDAGFKIIHVKMININDREMHMYILMYEAETIEEVKEIKRMYKEKFNIKNS